MSLQITTTLKTPQGFEITNAYGRVAALNAFKGDTLQAAVQLYVSEASFEAGDLPFEVNGLNLGLTAPYEYTPATENILDIAHDLLIAFLAEQGVTAQKSL